MDRQLSLYNHLVLDKLADVIIIVAIIIINNTHYTSYGKEVSGALSKLSRIKNRRGNQHYSD